MRIRQAIALALAIGALGCLEDVVEPRGPEGVTVHVRADLNSTSVTSVVMTVTGPGIQEPLVFNLAVLDGVASGTITIPTGSDRTIVMRAYNAAGIETHRGSTTVDIHPGSNPGVTLTLTPLSGEVEVTVTLGSLSIEVTPSADTLAGAGNSVDVTATVEDEHGNPIDVVVQWATLDPGVATVQRTGDRTATVTAVRPWETLIVATFAGFGGAASLVVMPQLQPVVTSGPLPTSPIYVTTPPGDASRLFVVERAGRIVIVRNGEVESTPFLDIRSSVSTTGERGLLSMAFHPSYGSNGYLFVSYTNNDGDTRIVRYQVSGDPDVANPASVDTILAVDQPAQNHNGGLIAFGLDGMLYIGLGDGGGGGDPHGNGQDSTTLLGSLLRLDVDGAPPYAIPGGNPFVDDPGADEIWSYGLRNPWRFSFDRQLGDLYLADVGQHEWEEVDYQAASSSGGENFGWNTMEGTHCYDSEGCDQAGLALPIFEYGHDEGCSITGGYVYRGSSLPALRGHYVYGDFCGGWVRSFRRDGTTATDHRDYTASFGTFPGSLVSFGEDAAGELYVVSRAGQLYRIVP